MTNAEEHLACRKCNRRHLLSTIRKFTSWFDHKFRQRILTELDNQPNDSTQVLENFSQENIATKMWLGYTKTPEYRKNMAGENNIKLEVKVETKGLVTYLSANCGLRSRKLPSGHCIPIHLPRKDGITRGNAHAAYDINKQSVLMAHQMGSSWFSTSKAFSTLGTNYFGQQAFEYTEEIVGQAITIVANQSMKDALKEEIKLSTEAGDGTYTTVEYGNMPALMMSTDAAWQRRSSGRRYDSASGVIHFIGVRSGKVCDTEININRCQVCSRVQAYKDKKVKAKAKKKQSNVQKYKAKLKQIKPHRCMQNFWGNSKAMESNSIVKMVRNFPEKRNAYVRVLIMDDDATTPSHLKEDTGPKSKGTLPKSLAGIEVLADPSHRKRVVGGTYYKLSRKKWV